MTFIIVGQVTLYFPNGTDIKLGITAVQTEKMPLETIAEPVTGFRYHRPVLDFLVFTFIERPGIVTTGQLQRPAGSQSEFKTQIHRRCRIVQQVGFHPYFLTENRGCHANCKQHQGPFP